MHKKLHALASGQSFTDFVDRISSRWHLRTQPSAPGVSLGETPEEILRDLIAMPTVTGNTEAMHNGLDYIDQFLGGLGMHVSRLEWNGVEALVATTRPTKTPTVFLAGHLDVVPGDPSMFELRQEHSKYYGRGVLDMKGAIAAYLSVIKDLPGKLADYDFGVMIMTDEEIGGFDGAANLAAEGYLPKVMILPDGGSDWNVESFAKGLWHVTIEARGKSAHGSRPWEGENAIDNLTALLTDIKALFPDMNPTSNTINIGTIEGGEAINQIPAMASASIDMRFASAPDHQRISRLVSDMAAERGMTLTVDVEADPMANDPANPLLSTYASVTEAVIGRPVKWVTSNAANDGRYFASKGVVCAISYPPGGNHHGPGEWIEKQSYEQMQQIIRTYIEKVAKTSPAT